MAAVTRIHRITCADTKDRDRWYTTPDVAEVKDKAAKFDRYHLICAPHRVEFSDDKGKTWEKLDA